MGIRGVLPYIPARVLRQFGRTQIIPQIGSTGEFAFDYDHNRPPRMMDCVREWRGRLIWGPETISSDRYHPGCIDEYDAWLRADLQGTLLARPILYNRIEDKDSQAERRVGLVQRRADDRDAKYVEKIEHDKAIIEGLRKELRCANECLVELNNTVNKTVDDIEPLEFKERGYMLELTLTFIHLHLQAAFQRAKTDPASSSSAGGHFH